MSVERKGGGSGGLPGGARGAEGSALHVSHVDIVEEALRLIARVFLCLAVPVNVAPDVVVMIAHFVKLLLK